MRPLTTARERDPADTLEESPAEVARRTDFLAGARPALDRAYRLAGLLLADGHEAEDAVQDALATAWQSFDTLRDPNRFGPWFDRILVNGCRDRLRRRSLIRFVAIDGEAERLPATRSWRSSNVTRCWPVWPFSRRTSGSSWCSASGRIFRSRMSPSGWVGRWGP